MCAGGDGFVQNAGAGFSAIKQNQGLFKARFWALDCEKLTCRMRWNISQPSAECARIFEIQK